jgi:predicted DNA-binding protein (MmcQ/YjbR family)
MTSEEFDVFCAGLPQATHVVQWGDASVWKVGGKVFAIGGWSESSEFAVTFKCSEASFAVLKDLPGLRPAPYLASRGLTWIQRNDCRTLGDADLKDYLRRSYALAVGSLPAKRRRELGFERSPHREQSEHR